MTDGDRQAASVGKFLQCGFLNRRGRSPCFPAIGDQQFVGLGIGIEALVVPPVLDVVDGKLAVVGQVPRATMPQLRLRS